MVCSEAVGFSLSHYFRPLADSRDNIWMGVESLLKEGNINNISNSKQLTIMEKREKSILKQNKTKKLRNGLMAPVCLSASF